MYQKQLCIIRLPFRIPAHKCYDSEVKSKYNHIESVFLCYQRYSTRTTFLYYTSYVINQYFLYQQCNNKPIFLYDIIKSAILISLSWFHRENYWINKFRLPTLSSFGAKLIYTCSSTVWPFMNIDFRRVISV